MQVARIDPLFVTTAAGVAVAIKEIRKMVQTNLEVI